MLPFQAWKTLCVCVMEKKKRKGLTSDDNPNRSLATEELMTHYNKGSRAISGLTSLDDGSGVLYSASSCDATDERTIVSSSLSLFRFLFPVFFLLFLGLYDVILFTLLNHNYLLCTLVVLVPLAFSCD